jgi:hypothetical protein
MKSDKAWGTSGARKILSPGIYRPRAVNIPASIIAGLRHVEGSGYIRNGRIHRYRGILIP